MSEPNAEVLEDVVQMGKLLSDIADADGDAGTIMRLIDAFAARRVADAHAEWTKYDEAIRAEERERCAKLAESEVGGMEYEDGNCGDAYDSACREIAARIRAVADKESAP